MPFNKYYSGPLIREGMEFEPVNLLGDNEPFNTQVASNFTKVRLRNNNPLQAVSLVDNVFNYAREMEYFAAYAENLRNIDKLFKNKYIKDAIVDIHGQQFYNLVTSMVDKIAVRGITKGRIKAGQILNNFNNVFIFSTLGLNPSIALKQLTSIPTFMNEIGPANWIEYSAL